MNEPNISSLESICNVLYNASDEQERSQAGLSLYGFLEDPVNFRSLFQILGTSMHPQLVYLTLSALSKLLPLHWKSLSSEQKQLLYQTVLNLMLDGQDRAIFVYGGIAKALSRICRLGWLEQPLFKSVVESCKLAQEQNFYISEVIFKFYAELIPEMTDPIKHRPISVNRKTAISFRDDVLIHIFEHSLYFLAKIQELPGQLLTPIFTALNLCLSFDFLGISSDETSEDSICLQVPMTWKHIFESPVILDYVGLVIVKGVGEQEVLALRCFNHLGAVRKSIFGGSLELRQGYIGKYLSVLSNALKSKQWEEDSLFEVMQLVRRFLSNFSLREVADNLLFVDWLQTFAEFTIVHMARPEALYSSYYSGMHVWSYLATESAQHMQTGNPVSGYSSGIFKAFLQYTLQNACEENLPFDRESELKDHMEQVANFSAFYYGDMMRELQEQFAKWEQRDEKLAWLMFVASGLLGLKDKSEEGADAAMIHLVFSLIVKGGHKRQQLYEAATLSFFQAVNKTYLNSAREWSFYNKSEGAQVNGDMLQRVIATIVERVLFIISNYSNRRLVGWAIDLLQSLCRGYYSSKALIKLQIIQNLLVNYKSYPICSTELKDRERVFKAIADLWTSEELPNGLTTLLQPMSQHISSIGKAPQLTDVANVLRQLKGICSSLTSQRLFSDFFDWFNDQNWQLVFIALRNFLYNDSVMSSLFGLLTEMTTNRNTRIKFDSSSAHGIVLFRTLSQVLLGYGNFLMDRPLGSNPYNEVYSKVRKLLLVFRNLLAGGYISFGVFDIYGDTCFVDTLNMTMALVSRIPREELVVSHMQTYTKLLDILYEIVEMTAKFHLGLVFTQMSSDHFRLIMFLLKHGVNSTSKPQADMKYTLSTSNAISSLTEFVIKKSQKETAESQTMQRVLQDSPGELSQLLELILEVVLTEDSSYMWSLSKPLLGLIIVNESQYEDIKNFAISRVTGSAHTQAKMAEALAALMAGVTRSLDTKNREHFGKRFTDLRQAVSAINNQ